MKLKFKWENICDNGETASPHWEGTYRSKVFGGWLLRHEAFTDYNEDNDVWCHMTNVLVFIPDPNHEWEIE